MFNLFRKSDSGLFVKLGPDNIVYKNEDSIIKEYRTSCVDNLYYIISVEPDELKGITIGPFANQKLAQKALSRLAKNQTLRIHPFFTLFSIIAFVSIISYSVKPNQIVESHYPNYPSLNAITDDPMTSMEPNMFSHQTKKISKPEIASSIPPSKESSDFVNKMKIIQAKITAITDASKNHKAITPDMYITSDLLEGIPNNIANPLKNTAIALGVFQVDTEKEKEKTLKSGGVLLSNIPSTPETNLPPSEPGDTDLVKIPSNSDEKIKDIQKKQKEFSNPSNIETSSSDYNNYNDFAHDYPDLKAKSPQK